MSFEKQPNVKLVCVCACVCVCVCVGGGGRGEEAHTYLHTYLEEEVGTLAYRTARRN